MAHWSEDHSVETLILACMTVKVHPQLGCKGTLQSQYLPAQLMFSQLMFFILDACAGSEALTVCKEGQA